MGIAYMEDIECLRMKLHVFEIFRSVDLRFGIIWDIPYSVVHDKYEVIPDFNTDCEYIYELARSIQKKNGGPIEL